ncbi:hypothetical protein SAMN06298212_10426 [Ruaniaceae bacterium KH17]|nr:hypothetical protein SAMN06298212_10426 [Ruaniaceae bacterium KH17]
MRIVSMPEIRFARTHALVLVGRLTAPAVRRIDYARSLRPTTIEAVHVAVNPSASAGLRQQWKRDRVPIPLTILERHHADIVQPVLRYVDEVTSPNDLVIVVLPAFAGLWARITQRWRTARLRRLLEARDGVAVLLVRWEGE